MNKHVKPKEGPLEWLFTFLKGLLVGVSDLIPGVSGGTIIFITGIYERFIHGLANVGKFFKEFFMKLIGKRKETHKKIFSLLDFALFLPLVLGIWLVYTVGSKYILMLISAFPAEVYSFFIGLIIASAYFVYKGIDHIGLKQIIFGVVGLALGILVANAAFASGHQPGFVEVFVLGMIAITAMILPGISGSYMLLIFGQYEYFLGVLSNIFGRFEEFLIFAAGSVAGILLFSKILSWLLDKHRAATLSLLVGLMVGAASGPGKIVIADLTSVWVIVFSIIFLLIGMFSVHLLEKYSGKKHI